MDSSLIGFITLGVLSLLGALVSLVGTLVSIKNEHRLTRLETLVENLDCRTNGCSVKD